MGQLYQEIVDKQLQHDTAESTITLGAESTITLGHKTVTLGHSRQYNYTKTQYIGQSHWTGQTGQLHYHTVVETIMLGHSRKETIQRIGQLCLDTVDSTNTSQHSRQDGQIRTQ